MELMCNTELITKPICSWHCPHNLKDIIIINSHNNIIDNNNNNSIIDNNDTINNNKYNLNNIIEIYKNQSLESCEIICRFVFIYNNNN